MRVLGVVHGRLRHEGKAVHGRRSGRASNRLTGHVWPHPPNVIPRRRPRAHLGLRGVASWTIRGVWPEHTVRDRGRRRRCLMPDVGKGRLGLKVRRQHLSIYPVTLGRTAVLVLFLLLIGPAGEIGRTLVLVWSSML